MNLILIVVWLATTDVFPLKKKKFTQALRMLTAPARWLPTPWQLYRGVLEYKKHTRAVKTQTSGANWNCTQHVSALGKNCQQKLNKKERRGWLWLHCKHNLSLRWNSWVMPRFMFLFRPISVFYGKRSFYSKLCCFGTNQSSWGHF